MRPPNRNDLAVLLADRAGPCVSIYMATDRSYPANKQGPIRYANAALLGVRSYPRRALRRCSGRHQVRMLGWGHGRQI